MQTHKQTENTNGCHAVDQQFDLDTGTVQVECLQARVWKACFTERAEQPQAALTHALRVEKAKVKQIPYSRIRKKKEALKRIRGLQSKHALAASAIG